MQVGRSPHFAGEGPRERIDIGHRPRQATTFTAKSAKNAKSAKYGKGLQVAVFLGVLGDLGGRRR